MKNKTTMIIGIIVLIILVIGIAIWLYFDIQENKRIDAEAVTLKSDLTAGFGEKVKVSNFLENLNGELLNDYEINTETLGEVPVTLEFKNIKHKKRKRTFNIKIVDNTKPKIFGGNSYTITVGTVGKEKNLTYIFLSGDDVDDNPVREIIGEYDINTPGKYNLTYSITDSSNNTTTKNFVLNVKEPTPSIEKPAETTTPEPTYLDDVIENYKTDNTQIGIDVSKWQGKIDWKKVKDAGIEFAMIRIGTQMGYDDELKIDQYFKENIEGAKAVGLPVGGYFYSYAKTPEQGIEQAQWVIDQIRGYEFNLPIAFDWESWNSFNKTGMSFYTINKVADVFMNTLEQAGYKGMLYGSKNYLTTIWKPTKYETWLAHYTSKTNYKGDYLIWQMCSDGRVNGISGNVDLDIMYLKK